MELQREMVYIFVMEISVTHYPQLRQLCWNRPADAVLSGKDALALYERNWRFVDEAALTVDERNLIDRLVQQYGGGTFLAA